MRWTAQGGMKNATTIVEHALRMVGAACCASHVAGTTMLPFLRVHTCAFLQLPMVRIRAHTAWPCRFIA